MTFSSNTDTDRVKRHWNEKPLFKREIEAGDLVQYFSAIDRLKREEVEPFSLDFWEFDRHAGENVLDIGCGPGWLAVHYALGGARVTALDMSSVSLGLCRRHMAHRNAQGVLINANCERLPFKDACFDFISASGVLHHTPQPEAGVREIFRVLKPGGRALVTLYYRNFLLTPALLPVTLAFLRLFRIRKPDAEFGQASDLNELGALYDGSGNPFGKIYSKREARTLFQNFHFDPVRDVEIHYFPRRFMPFGSRIRGELFRFLDRCMGLMIYFKLTKPALHGMKGTA